jgi:predicted transcriptional regulator
VKRIITRNNVSSLNHGKKKKELKRHKIGLKKHEPFIEEDKWM